MHVCAATIIIVLQYFSSKALEKQSKPLPHIVLLITYVKLQ